MQMTPLLSAGMHCHKEYRPERPSVAVLVRVKNEIRGLPAFWRSLQEQSIFASLEACFLDSGSDDGTLEYLLELPCSVYSISSESFSFGRSCNQLMSVSQAPICIFLSGHVVLSSSDMVSFASNEIGRRDSSAGFFRQVPNEEMGSSIYERAYLRRRFPVKTHCVQLLGEPNGFSNAASIVSRKSWEDHPFPDIHGSEDYQWAVEHLIFKRDLLYFPCHAVQHSHNESPEQVYERVRLNVVARHQERSYRKFLFYVIGVTVSLLLSGGSMKDALRYGVSHARAYL